MLFYANGVSYASPNVPVLLQILSGTPGAMDLMPAGSIYYLPPNMSIEITMPALPLADPGHPHPFHLHGVRSHDTPYFLGLGLTTVSISALVLRCSQCRPGNAELRQPGPP